MKLGLATSPVEAGPDEAEPVETKSAAMKPFANAPDPEEVLENRVKLKDRGGASLAEPAVPQERSAAAAVAAMPAPIADPVASSVSAPTGEEKPAAAEIGVVVTAPDAHISPEVAIRSVGAGRKVVFVTADPGGEAASAARRAGADVVEVQEETMTPGRARNAGYRQLKKLAPDLDFVQFLDAQHAVDPDWLDTAARFLDRRPEVAAIEGEIQDQSAKKSAFSQALDMARDHEPGEIQAAGANAFFRADAFETAGGFRGDIPVNETEDLCIRLRRRGAHIWRVESEMAVSEARPLGLAGWWRERVACGYKAAAGAALHGAPPERFGVAEQSRSIFWGLVFPAAVLVLSAAAAISVMLFSGVTGPVAMFATALGLGLAIYFAKIVLTAFSKGPQSAASWNYGLMTTLGYVPSAIGVMRYAFGGRKARRRDAARASAG